MSKDLSWDDAVFTIMQESDGSLHYTEIANLIVERELRSNLGATPSASVAAILSSSIRSGNSPYVRTARGEYALKSELVEKSRQQKEVVADAKEMESGAIQAFGMYWKRADINWEKSNPLILGREPGGDTIDFREQIGVYLLHDDSRVIYVGRAKNEIGSRLRAHTNNRLGGRWNRFSWFGVRAVLEDLSLSEPHSSWTNSDVIETMEAILIETLEPPLNRKRGDNFEAVEYLQVSDPDLVKSRENLAILKRLGLGS